MLETIALDRVTAKGYGFQIETTYRTLRAGFRVVEVPITFTDRRVGESKMSGAIVVEAMLQVPVIRWRALRGSAVALPYTRAWTRSPTRPSTARCSRASVPVIVEFGAPWCRPCKAIEPALAEIADGSGGRLRLVKLDIDANLRTPSRYGVLSVPTVILFQGRGAARDADRRAGQEPLRAAFAPYVDA